MYFTLFIGFSFQKEVTYILHSLFFILHLKQLARCFAKFCLRE